MASSAISFILSRSYSMPPVLAASISARVPYASKGGSHDLDDSNDVVILSNYFPMPLAPSTAIITRFESNPRGGRESSLVPGTHSRRKRKLIGGDDYDEGCNCGDDLPLSSLGVKRISISIAKKVAKITKGSANRVLHGVTLQAANFCGQATKAEENARVAKAKVRELKEESEVLHAQFQSYKESIAQDVEIREMERKNLLKQRIW
ncbi:UNVERIFIED_CONTAM: hypothetical protein Sradi_3233800 [Sesamum radiatum]|uniref:Uncharacterized protein n=1 Tax=Sesamum radiatum TaxID=300843 RepID=A0AAW2RHG7_SESRA